MDDLSAAGALDDVANLGIGRLLGTMQAAVTVQALARPWGLSIIRQVDTQIAFPHAVGRLAGSRKTEGFPRRCIAKGISCGAEATRRRMVFGNSISSRMAVATRDGLAFFSAILTFLITLIAVVSTACGSSLVLKATVIVPRVVQPLILGVHTELRSRGRRADVLRLASN